jgi:hypothetical protein
MTMLFCSAVVSPGRANTRLSGALLTAAHVPGDLSQSLDTAERYLLESNATVAAHVRKVRGLFFGGRTNVPVDASTLATVESALTRLIGNFPSDLASAKAHTQAELLTSVSVFATLYGLRKRHAELMQRCSLLASTAMDLLSAPTEEGAEMLKVMKARAQAVAAQPLFAESKTHATLMQGHTAGTELVVGVPVDPAQCLGALAFGSPSSAPWPADQHPVVATLDQHTKSTFVVVTRTKEAVGETTLYDDKVTRDMGFAPMFVDATTGEEVTSVTSLRRLVTGGVDVRFTAVSPAAAPAPAPAAAAPVIVPPPVTGSPSSPTASSVSTAVATSKASSAGTIPTPPGSAKAPSPKTTPKGASAPPPKASDGGTEDKLLKAYIRYAAAEGYDLKDPGLLSHDNVRTALRKLWPTEPETPTPSQINEYTDKLLNGDGSNDDEPAFEVNTPTQSEILEHEQTGQWRWT